MDAMHDLPLAITRLLWLVDALTDDQYLRAAVLYDQITARCPATAFADILELIMRTSKEAPEASSS